MISLVVGLTSRATEPDCVGPINFFRQTAKGTPVTNLKVIEIKAFVPAKDFELSKQFYLDLGFTKASDGGGVAYFRHDDASFLLQDFYQEGLANNLMMHLQVEDVDAWYTRVRQAGIVEKYGVKMTEPQLQPWRMRDFVLIDPSGVMWRIAQNIN